MIGWLYILSNNTRGYVRVQCHRRGAFLVNEAWNIKYPMSEKKLYTNRIRTFDTTKWDDEIHVAKDKVVIWNGGGSRSIGVNN